MSTIALNPRLLILAAALEALALVPSARAEAPTGATCHGAGGPFLGAIVLRPRGSSPVTLLTIGGAGYTYLLDGRLRLGGGGQNTSASSEADGRRGSLAWGMLHLAWDPWAAGAWEFPLAVGLGGGRVFLESTVSAGPPQVLERDSATFFGLQASGAVEYRLARTVKLGLHLSWLGAFNEGLAAQAAEATLRLVFLLPLPGR
ncbi:MAG: hypothetical protein HY901_03295 [Deltaproteobacteria bacterium]|nr:hypothetical protein [Deltaproteobacteria bacterium]